MAHLSHINAISMGNFGVEALRASYDGPLDLAEHPFKGTYEGINFGDEVDFSRFRTSGDVFFNGCQFGSASKWSESHATHSVTFKQCSFGDNAVFSGSAFLNGIKFDQCKFSNGLNFSRCKKGDLSFSDCDIRTYCKLDGAEGISITDDGSYIEGFSLCNAKQIREINFHKTIFFNLFKAHNSEVGKAISFTYCRFSTTSSFEQNKFFNLTEYTNCSFERSVSFINSGFLNLTNFAFCKFQDFDISCAAETGHSLPRIGHIRFHSCIFNKTASFKNRVFGDSTSFRKSVFKVAPFFHNSELHQDTEFLKEQFQDIKTDEAERAYRTLKLAMNKHHAHAEEMMFFKFEMQARRCKTRGPSKALYWIYEIFSDYGQSIMRPLIGLGCVFTIFTIVYWLAKYGGKPFPNWEAASSLLAFTLSRTLPVVIPAMPKLSLEFGAIGPFAEAILIGLQSLMSGALLFLLALGIRNRFRLKG